jgi:hypothetical protein
MAFVPITSGEIASGQPVSTTTQTKIKNDLDDHETRLETLEISISSALPITLRVNGFYGVFNSVLKTTADGALTITGVRLLIDVAGTAGTTEIDIKKKRGSGSYTSIFTTLPSVAFSAGNDAISTNGIVDLTQVGVQAGDILRLDITSTQTAGLSFLVRIDYN